MTVIRVLERVSPLNGKLSTISGPTRVPVRSSVLLSIALREKQNFFFFFQFHFISLFFFWFVVGFVFICFGIFFPRVIDFNFITFKFAIFRFLFFFSFYLNISFMNFVKIFLLPFYFIYLYTFGRFVLL